MPGDVPPPRCGPGCDFFTVETLEYLQRGGRIGRAAALAGLAEYRRNRRRLLDRVGWVPWNAVQVIAFMASVVERGRE